MTRNDELGRELLKQNDAAGGGQAVAPEAMVRSIVDRERRRIRRWGWAAAILWIFIGVHMLIERLAVLFVTIYIYPARLQEGRGFPNTFGLTVFIVEILWPLLLCAAALCTMKFILVSRQATLRQIQGELAEISRQMQALTKAP
jgi:hypothetical protein